MSSDHELFSRYDWSNLLELQKTKARKKAEELKIEAFDKDPPEKLAEAFTIELSVKPPSIRPDDIEVKQREIQIDVNRHDPYRSGRQFVKGTEISVYLPFRGDDNMFYVRPTAFDFDPPRGHVEKSFVVFSIRGTSLTPEAVKQHIDSVVESISSYLLFQGKSAKTFPQEIRAVALQALKQRKAKLEADRDLISGLGYKTRK